MEDKYPIKEIKVMDGVYIWKPDLQNSNNKTTQSSDNNNNNKIGKKTSVGENNYICHGVDELVKIYEIEFEEIGNKIQSLFQSNEEMLEFDPHDYDLIQAREENLQLIDKKIEEMMKIQEKMKDICNYHPIVTVDIFDHFGIGKKIKDNEDNKEKKKEENLALVDEEDKKNEENINSINDLEEKKKNNNNEEEQKKENKKQKDNEIITEIDL